MADYNTDGFHNLDVQTKATAPEGYTLKIDYDAMNDRFETTIQNRSLTKKFGPLSTTYDPSKSTFTIKALTRTVGPLVAGASGSYNLKTGELGGDFFRCKKVAEAVSNVVKKVAKAVGDAVRKVATAVSDGVKKVAEARIHLIFIFLISPFPVFAIDIVCESSEYIYSSAERKYNVILKTSPAISEDIKNIAAQKIGQIWLALEFNAENEFIALCSQNGRIICDFVRQSDFLLAEDLNALRTYQISFLDLDNENQLSNFEITKLHPWLSVQPSVPEYVVLDDSFYNIIARYQLESDLLLQFTGCGGK